MSIKKWRSDDKCLVDLNKILIDSISVNLIDFKINQRKDDIELNILFHWRYMKLS